MEQDLTFPLSVLTLLCLLLAVVNFSLINRLRSLESSIKLLLVRQAESFFDMRTTLNVQNGVQESLLGNPLSDLPTEETQSPMDQALTHLRRIRDALQYARAMHVLSSHYGDNILHALGADSSKSYSVKEVVEFIIALDNQPVIPEFLPMRGTMVSEPVGKPNPGYAPNHGYSVGGNGAGYSGPASNGGAGASVDWPSVQVAPAGGIRVSEGSTELRRK